MKKEKTFDNSSTTSNSKQLQILKTNFPQCFDKNGDFIPHKMQEVVAKDGINLSKESYSLNWLGKSYARLLANEQPLTLLKEDTEHNQKEANQNSENLLIKGDNLEVLKHLRYAYSQSIKMIYIDPPYNTGGDGFVYQDDRKFTNEQLQSLAGIDEDEAKRILDFTASNSNSHSAWLTFIYPRLYIARELLTDDGVIFISIDGNEQAQLKMLCDEIFGEENFVSELKIQVRYENKSLNEKKDFQEVQESVFIYAKNFFLPHFNKPTEAYSLNKFNLEIRHNEKPTKTIEKNGRKMDVWLNGDFTIQKIDKPSEKHFKETWLTGSIYSNTGHGTMYKRMIENRTKEDGVGCLYRIYGIGEDGLGYRYYTNPREKKYNKGKMYTKVPLNQLEKIKQGKQVLKENPIISYADFSADFGNIRHEGGVSFNSGKKPVKMLKQFINYIKNNQNDIVLDFFAGSGTTADAVMQLNAEDGGNRKCISVQIAEPIDEKKNKTAYDFVKEELGQESPAIFDITKERILRASVKIQQEQKNNKDLFSKNKNQNFGFKVFETLPMFDGYLDDMDELDEQQTLFDGSHLSDDDLTVLLTSWMVNDGIKLTSKVEKITLDKYESYYADETLYLMNKGFTTDDLKAFLEKLDSVDGDNKNFKPNKIILFGYNFESKHQREISEALSGYSNRKGIELDKVVRY